MSNFPYAPRNEGVDHINTYSKSSLTLGRMLSNFAHAPMNLPEDGEFASMEAYWFWLSSKDDSLRPLYGSEAKKLGTKARAKAKIIVPDFEEKIKEAAKWKLKQNLTILHALKESTLPLVHYYVVKDGNKRIAYPAPGADWLWHHYMELRALLRNEPPPPPYVKPEEPTIHEDGTLSLF